MCPVSGLLLLFSYFGPTNIAALHLDMGALLEAKLTAVDQYMHAMIHSVSLASSPRVRHPTLAVQSLCFRPITMVTIPHVCIDEV